MVKNKKNGKELWIREYYDMLSGWGKMIAEGKSPFEDCYNNGGTDLIKLIESWGYFSEYYLMWQRYKEFTIVDIDNKQTGTLGDKYFERLEYRKIPGYSKTYFYYGGLFDLFDSDNEEGVDFCENFNYESIYMSITTSGVNDIYIFSKILTERTGRIDELENVIKTLERNHEEKLFFINYVFNYVLYVFLWSHRLLWS